MKPPDGTIVIVLFPLLLRAIVTVPGDAVTLKLPTPTTVSASVVVACTLPDVPVIVTVAVPFGAEALATRVSVLVEVAGFGVNTAVTPLGKPDAENVTLPLKPFAGVIVIVLVP